MEERLRPSLPSLDPNGQPFSMVLRGDAADLGELRSALASLPDARRQLRQELLANAPEDDGDQFGDVDEEGMTAEEEYEDSEVVNGTPAHEPACMDNVDDGVHGGTGQKKRGRDDDGRSDDSDDEEDLDDDIENQEQLMLYLPSVLCTCASWEMEACGDLFVTTLRIMFLGQKQDDDVAIDGRCIALHAVDSLPGDDEVADSHHVYCQIAEPMGEEFDGGCTSAISMAAPTQITGENDDILNAEGDVNVEGEELPEDDSTTEVYFKPASSSEDEQNADQCEKCQSIFNALTRLASLNPAGDADDAGGLFSMLAMMAGLDNNGLGGGMVMAGYDDSDNDDMVVRLGGSNNLVENDDDSSAGAPEEERQAMLQRLDDMLVVPPEYEVASLEDGQFDDAEDEDDAIL
ncbi:hypothetical protein ACHAWF_015761 [Thalassiosira exigua]